MELRRFHMKKGNANDFFTWCNKKGLSRNDLIYILDSVELNQGALPKQNTADALRQEYPRIVKHPRRYLITLRSKRGMTFEDAAWCLNVSTKFLAMIEAGLWDLKLSTIKGFTKLYDVSVEQLIAEEAKYKQDLQDTEDLREG